MKHDADEFTEEIAPHFLLLFINEISHNKNGQKL
jgi:hypothetical protein